MIKRYSISTPIAALRKRYGASLPKKHRPIVNAGVKKLLPILTKGYIDEFKLFNWGIIPADSHDAHIGEKLMNARVETLKAKQPFCDLLANRCLIPADGFYVWKDENETDAPYRAVLPSQSTFSIIGLFHEWGEDDEEFASIVKTFTMITCEGQNQMEQYGQRTPLIIPKNLEKDWLIGKDEDEIIKQAIEYTKSLKFEIYQVSELINNEKNNQIKLVQNEDHTLPGQTLSLF
ncbi:SOS response-associated peptidase [Cyclobacteriaceae bacterium]|nr:SOS response-associated peptidase [Cyclobacteriaceae bacterium]